MTDDEYILICAVRYAVGRRTYVVADARRWVQARWPNLGAQARGILLRDIASECEREDRVPGHLGDRCDVDVWRGLLAWMRERTEV